MRIGIVGGGVSGLLCAYLLCPHHDVTLFEQAPAVGGHTNTVTVRHEGRAFAVDTGFIVFNEKTYPNFVRLLQRLGVASRPTTMSFSVRDEATGFEYGGETLAGVVGAWTNLLRPRWWRVVSGVLGLGERGPALLASLPPDATVEDLARGGELGRGVVEDFLMPMAGAVWSAPRGAMRDFPARFLLRFFDNHGMLDVRGRLTWRTIAGGSARYIDAMMPSIRHALRTGAAAGRIERSAAGVSVVVGGERRDFDEVILACHTDQALALLADASPAERDILSAMPYQPNSAVLHTDARALPRRRRCWAAWNFRAGADPSAPVAVTYNMSMLQGLATREPLCVTLNDDALDPAKVLGRFAYHHPVYTIAGEAARARWAEISGPHTRTHYCGAAWGNGFHEDGVNSALRVCARWGVSL
jgi:predicted NAD/FAD-binding protein